MKYTITGDIARQAICKAVESYEIGMVVSIAKPTRSSEQNAAMWAALTDLSEQTNWHGIKLSTDEWKDLLSAGLVKAKVVPNITGDGFVILGQRTSKMTKRQMGDLLDLIFSFGIDRGVKFSEPERF